MSKCPYAFLVRCMNRMNGQILVSGREWLKIQCIAPAAKLRKTP